MMVIFLITFLSLWNHDVWELLSQVKVEEKFDELLGEKFDRPTFSADLKKLDGKVVTIEGYVIPIQSSVEQDYFVLSRFPYQTCFFCGKAGPETVVEVYPIEQHTINEMQVKVTGQLVLNEQDPLHLFYMLIDSKVQGIDNTKF